MSLNLIEIWKQKGKIAEGVANAIFKKEHVEEIAEKRRKTCESCAYIDREGKSCALIGTQPCCSLCGCSLGLKTRSLSSSCDKEYWTAIVNQDEEDLIKENL
jgi:hypothetical protein